MFERIDPRLPTPLYAQLAADVRIAIAGGELSPGDPLPSVRQLAGQLRINPATVVQAYRALEADGLVATRQGTGTFVADAAPARSDRDRKADARRLVRTLLDDAGKLGISAADVRSALDHEMNGRSTR